MGGRTPDAEEEHTTGRFGADVIVYQRRVLLQKHGDYYPILGAWIVADQFAGVVVREDRSKITTLNSVIAPCRIERQ